MRIPWAKKCESVGRVPRNDFAKHFTILEPRNAEMCELYEALKRRSTDYADPRL